MNDSSSDCDGSGRGGCDGCEAGVARRDFLRAALVISAGTLVGVALGGLPGAARTAFAVQPASPVAPVPAGSRKRRYAIPATDGASIDEDGQVILVRYQKAMYAFALSCPHQRTALRWLADKNRFQCPKHKSKYQPDGTFIEGRATRSMDRYPIAREGDAVIVDTAVLYKSDAAAAAWKAAVVAL